MDLQSRRNLICGQSNNNNCVKDKDNLASHNFWSGGDYLKNTNGILSLRSTLELSTISSHNQYSIKVIRPTTSTGTSGIQIKPVLAEQDIGKEITVSCDIYTPNNSVSIQIYSNNYVTINIPVNDKFYTYQATHKISITNTIIAIFMNVKEEEQYYYIDNVNVSIK